MAADDLPTEYDDIVLGTGVQESIVAAALSRIGRRVLHLDRNDYYSGEWASFHLKGILDWVEKANSRSEAGDSNETHQNEDPSTDTVSQEAGERLIPVPPPHSTISNVIATVHIKEKPDEVECQRVPDTAAAAAAPPEAEQAHQSHVTTPAAQHGEVACDSTASQAQGGDPHQSAQGGEETGNPSLGDSTGDSVHGDAAGPQGGDGSQSESETPQLAEPVARVAGDVAEGGMVRAEESDQGSGQGNVQSAGEGQPPVDQAVQAPADRAVQAPSARESQERSWEDVRKEWRKFNIDLAPKLMFCRGSMVELLVSSRISRYAEFKAVTRILTHISGKLEQVPCSRADVFSSRYVSVLEKRMLMRLIEFCLDHENREDEYREFADRPFAEFLKSRKLTTTLQHFVIHSIAMVTADTPTQQALQAMRYFLRSLGRYGNTAFLWTLYGSGELPQCFCRMCAVFGGVYVLRTGIQGMITDNENNIKAVVDGEGRRLACRNLVMEYSYAPLQAVSFTPSHVSRGILITDKSVKAVESEQITLLTIPPLDGSRQPVHVIEVGYAACAAPRNLYLVHLTSQASDARATAQDDLRPVVDKFFHTPSPGDEGASEEEEEERPRVLWSLYFTQQDLAEIEDDALREGLPGNVHVTAGAGKSVGFDHAVAQAKRIFEKICPGEEFLPAAPDPDDLVFEDPAQDNPGHSQAGFEEGKASNEGASDASDTAQTEGQSSTTTGGSPRPETSGEAGGGNQVYTAVTNQSETSDETVTQIQGQRGVAVSSPNGGEETQENNSVINQSQTSGETVSQIQDLAVTSPNGGEETPENYSVTNQSQTSD